MLLTPVAGSEHAGGALLMLYGHTLMALGRTDEAEAAFRRWVRKEPESRDAALRLAAVLADTNRPTEAETVIRTVIARHGETPDAAFVLGRSLLGQARFDEAETVFRKVVHAWPERLGTIGRFALQGRYLSRHVGNSVRNFCEGSCTRVCTTMT